MDTHDRKVIDVLGDQKRFIVPFYQRHYKWHEPLWNSFWEDVRAKADEALTREPKFFHYMGALILSPESYSVAVTPRLLIVDGQQRLTTFQLFLAAMREVGDQLGYPQIGEAVRNYLFNRPMSGDTDTDARFKLAPNRADRETFYKLLESGLDAVRKDGNDWFFKNGRIIKGRAPNAVRALYFFKQTILEFARTGVAEEEVGEDTDATEYVDREPQNVHDRLQALLNAVLNYLKLVVITLGENDDAQVIFETLNSKSEPLTAMELVRNNIFHRATAEGEVVERLCEKKWEPLEQPFWNATAPRARPRRPRIDHFLSHALTAQTGEEISLRELYAEYRDFARPKGQPRFATVEAELDALLQYVPTYQNLEGEGNEPDLTWIGEKLMLWEVTTAYPVVFAVSVSSAEPEDKRRIYELLNSYLVRRAICGLTPKNLNKNFQRIVSTLLKDGVSVETFLQSFRGQYGDSVRFPSDEDVRDAVRSQPVYERFHRKDRLRELLWELEQAMRDKFAVDTPKPQSISIEHIMPQNWKKHWPLPNGKHVGHMDVMQTPEAFDEDTREAVARRRRLIHTLGNLTLVTGPANTVASNSSFEQKKPWLSQSLLAMNKRLTEWSSWTEQDILERSELLADLVVERWPGIGPDNSPRRREKVSVTP